MTGLAMAMALSIMACIVLLLVFAGSRHQRALMEARNEGGDEVQEDARLADVSAANDIRERVADVPDRMPPREGTDAAAKPERKGRRGPV